MGGTPELVNQLLASINMSQDPPPVGTVYAIYQDEALHLFAAVERSQFCGMDCIKGKAIRAAKEDWREGLVFHLPVSGITRIIEYPSLDEYRKVLADHYAKQGEA